MYKDTDLHFPRCLATVYFITRSLSEAMAVNDRKLLNGNTHVGVYHNNQTISLYPYALYLTKVLEKWR
jgi:hypothetical protein